MLTMEQVATVLGMLIADGELEYGLAKAYLADMCNPQLYEERPGQCLSRVDHVLGNAVSNAPNGIAWEGA